jgi:hypothetical protein
VLRRRGDAALLEEIALPALLEYYDGAENRSLLACLPLLPEKRSADLLRQLLIERGPSCIPGAMAFWTTLSEQQPARPRLLDSALQSLLEAITAASPPSAPSWVPSRFRELAEEMLESEEPAQIPSAAETAAFLAAIHASSCRARLREATQIVLRKPALFPPETVLLPALESSSLPPVDETAELWAGCAVHYLARAEQPPEPPHDWAQPATVAGRDSLLRELEAFARDPFAQVHRFRVNQSLRGVLHRAIEAAGLDMTHVTERTGRPQTLVCTKTRATYERACRQYTSDLADMRRLLDLPPTAAKTHAALAARLRKALAR